MIKHSVVMELKGKRLLYIGGSASITDIAFYTKSHGISC